MEDVEPTVRMHAPQETFHPLGRRVSWRRSTLQEDVHNATKDVQRPRRTCVIRDIQPPRKTRATRDVNPIPIHPHPGGLLPWEDTFTDPQLQPGRPPAPRVTTSRSTPQAVGPLTTLRKNIMSLTAPSLCSRATETYILVNILYVLQ